MRKFHFALGNVFACLLAIAISDYWALASTVAPGFAVSDFATGFANLGGIGPIGLAFDATGNLFVGNYTTGFLYKFGPAGGVASAATQLNAVVIGGHPAGLAFSKDSRLYAARQSSGDGGDVVELDPANGTILRKVAVIAGATGLATDPVSGDLFVSTGGIGLFAIWRVSNFASGPGIVTAYTPHAADGLAFGPDGTLYAASGGVLGIQGTRVRRRPALRSSSSRFPTSTAWQCQPTRTGPSCLRTAKMAPLPKWTAPPTLRR